MGQAKLSPLAPYDRVDMTLTSQMAFEKGKAYDFVLTIRTPDRVVSAYSFHTNPVEQRFQSPIHTSTSGQALHK